MVTWEVGVEEGVADCSRGMDPVKRKGEVGSQTWGISYGNRGVQKGVVGWVLVSKWYFRGGGGVE
eukprot:748073-Hanusia_phi.AAC.1